MIRNIYILINLYLALIIFVRGQSVPTEISKHPFSIIENENPHSLFQGGGFTYNQSQPCLTQERRSEIKSKLKSNIELLKQQGILNQNDFNQNRSSFVWPLRASDEYDVYSYYGISNFVDQNPNFPDMLLDYNCGNRTYDSQNGYNHSGTDIFTWPFSWHIMNNDEVEIIASAEGIIIGKDDGNYDQNCDYNDLYWNAVYILHNDGSMGWYGHMKSNSLTDKIVGDTVIAGEYLGIVGSSGNSTTPHLHFEIYGNIDDDGLIDPFQGDCNSLIEESWWIDQKPYYDSAINRIMTHSQAPEFYGDDCAEPANINEENIFKPNNYIFFAAYYRDQLAGQLSTWYVIDPDGNTYLEWYQEVDDYEHYQNSYWVNVGWFHNSVSLGEWKFMILYEEQFYEHNFTIFSMYGDLNFDGILNILDLVMIANMVLSDDFNTIADMNEDGILNVLDLVILVNIILEI